MSITHLVIMLAFQVMGIVQQTSGLVLNVLHMCVQVHNINGHSQLVGNRYNFLCNLFDFTVKSLNDVEKLKCH